MSFILDALRRADAERERGSVPSLHAHAAPTEAADGEGAERPRRGILLWLAAVSAIGLLSALAYTLLSRDAPSAMPPPMRQPTQQPTQPPIPTRAPVVPAVEAEPAAEAVPLQAPVPTLSPKPAAKAVATGADQAVSALSDAPESIRRELAALSVSGAMYSETAANRMLILNGQVFREGDAVSPSVVLEQIKLKSAVLVYKGQRYSISY